MIDIVEKLENLVQNHIKLYGEGPESQPVLILREAAACIIQLRERTRGDTALLETVRGQCENLNPDGYTAADFMAIWNQQYEAQIERAEKKLAAIAAIVCDKPTSKPLTPWEMGEYDGDI